MPRRSPLSEARAAASTAAAAWRAHKRMCWPCHTAGGRPGLFCEAGFGLAQDLTRTRLAVGAAIAARAPAQGTLL